MKKINPILILLLLSVGFTACMKDQEVYDPQEHLELEAPIISSYVDKDPALKDIAQKHETGIWYVVEKEGTGDYDYEKEWPNVAVTVKYSGKLLNGTEFDKSDSATFALASYNLITAWKYAFLPAMLDGEKVGITPTGLQKGAKIRFITPSPWAYGSIPQRSIPADSPLDFTVEVIDVKTLSQQ